ncbi:MAG TPA: class I SAM-dependent methyltransferase [Victivallales bacterium]|nr:class I SAM-dependent methyltransferase [Victivallales bacterium]
MDIIEYNQKNWDKESKEGIRWSIPVDHKTIVQAKNGKWNVILTPNKNVPKSWFGDIKNKKILCLASGGGQQAPVFAAAGAIVTSLDLSSEQLKKDKLVADRENLKIEIIQEEMANLSHFPDETFDIIFHPISNVFAPDITKVWNECFRVLKFGGRLLSGFMNPSFYLFDHFEADKTGNYKVKYKLPYSDIDSLTKEQQAKLKKNKLAFEFSHSLETQIGGQTKAGFVISDLYEDWWDNESTKLNKYSPTSIATLARKINI